MAKQQTQEASVNLVDQLTSILTHPEFLDHMNGIVGKSMMAPPEQSGQQELPPEDQKIIDEFLANYKARQDAKLTEPIPKEKSKGFSFPSLDEMGQRAKSAAKGVADNFEYSPHPGIGGPNIFPFRLKKDKTSPTPEDESTPSELAPGKKDEPEFGEQNQAGDLPDQTNDYQKLIDQLHQGATNLNDNINVASDASEQTAQALLNTYNKMIPIEPVTPLRILGDLVRVGGSLAAGKNPGLALALTGAGNAIKGYDPAYRDYVHRKNFATALLEGMTASQLKRTDAALAEAPEKRKLATEIGIAGIHEKGEMYRQKYHETSEDIRSRRAGETQLEAQGIKTGRATQLEQIQGIVGDSGPIKRELLKILDDSDYDTFTNQEKIHQAIQNHINKAYKGQNVNPGAISEAEKQLTEMLTREVLKKKK